MGKTIAANDQALASDVLSILNYGTAGNIPAAATVLVDSLYYETDTKILKQEQAGGWVEVARGETVIRLAQLAERAITNLTGRATKAQFEWTNAKLLLGAGAGFDPTEIDAPTARTIATGTYVGNDADNRQITTGFKASLVIVSEVVTGGRISYTTAGSLQITTGKYDATDCILHATDGFVVDQIAQNGTGKTYRYWAISE